MKPNNLYQRAKEELQNALCASIATSEYADIDVVFNSNNKTYKYILFTALTAKAVDNSINPICLQSSSELIGAYNARSLCHNVIVPFEQEHLGKALGGSNEPFLNKPARFKELSLKNPTKSAKDREILSILCNFLPQIDSSAKSFECLVYAIRWLKAHKQEMDNIRKIRVKYTKQENQVLLYSLIKDLLRKSYSGEVLTLVVAGLYHLHLSGLSKQFRIDVHPVNQSGASSKEISDLDIYKKKSLFATNELKDKKFSLQDVEHAVSKVRAKGFNRMFFIVGTSVKYDIDEMLAYIKELGAESFFLSVIGVDMFAQLLVGMTEKISIEGFVQYMMNEAYNHKFSEEVCRYILTVTRRYVKIVDAPLS